MNKKRVKKLKKSFKETHHRIPTKKELRRVKNDYLHWQGGEKTLQDGGLKVYTTLDLRLQQIAEEAVKAGVENNQKKYVPIRCSCRHHSIHGGLVKEKHCSYTEAAKEAYKSP